MTKAGACWWISSSPRKITLNKNGEGGAKKIAIALAVAAVSGSFLCLACATEGVKESPSDTGATSKERNNIVIPEFSAWLTLVLEQCRAENIRNLPRQRAPTPLFPERRPREACSMPISGCHDLPLATFNLPSRNNLQNKPNSAATMSLPCSRFATAQPQRRWDAPPGRRRFRIFSFRYREMKMSGMTMIFLTVMFFPPGILSQAQRRCERGCFVRCRRAGRRRREAQITGNLPPPSNFFQKKTAGEGKMI